MSNAVIISSAPVLPGRSATIEAGPVAVPNPARDSQLSLAGDRRLGEQRPMRMRSIVVALTIGLLIGGVVSMNTADASLVGDDGVDAKVEVGVTDG